MSGNDGVGVLDAGVIIRAYDPKAEGHAACTALLARSTSGKPQCYISAVTLAEVMSFRVTRASHRATGVSVMTLLSGWRVSVHQPDAETARRVADLATVAGLSLADRFAAATAQQLNARLYTTDRSLATNAAAKRIQVSKL